MEVVGSGAGQSTSDFTRLAINMESDKTRLQTSQLKSAPDAVDEDGVTDSLLVQALQEYQAAIDAGQPVNRKELVAKYGQVASELSACLESMDFVQHAASEVANRSLGKKSTSEIRPLATLGDYRILREIGRGGMGVVYEAEQLSLGRHVALKVLPFAAVLEPKQLQRFKNEAIAAGTLDHPNIVPVYSVGCERGVHYYAMRLIEGESLAESIAQLRQREQDESDESRTEHPSVRVPADTQPIAGLTTEGSVTSTRYFHAVATLGIQAADALQHAHEVGSDSSRYQAIQLVDGLQGNLWVTDFGLAQIAGRVEFDVEWRRPGDRPVHESGTSGWG